MSDKENGVKSIACEWEEHSKCDRREDKTVRCNCQCHQTEEQRQLDAALEDDSDDVSAAAAFAERAWSGDS